MKQLLAFTMVAVLLVSMNSGCLGLFDSNKEPVLSIENGDKVKLNYTAYISGLFGDNGKVTINGTEYTLGGVFATTDVNVANNANIVKVPSFLPKYESFYVPTQFTEGNNVLPRGVEQNISGMKVGETKYIVVPPAMGFGYGENSKIKTISLVESVPVYVNYTFNHFQSRFNDIPGSSDVGVEFVDPTYKWHVKVLEVNENAEYVIAQNMPDPEGTYHIYKWNSTIDDINYSANGGEGVIKVRNHAKLYDTAEDARSSTGITSGGIVTAIDTLNNTITLDYNLEQYGRTIIYHVQVVSIEKSPTTQ